MEEEGKGEAQRVSGTSLLRESGTMFALFALFPVCIHYLGIYVRSIAIVLDRYCVGSIHYSLLEWNPSLNLPN